MHFRKDKNVMMFYNINFSRSKCATENKCIYFLLDKCDAALFFLSYILRFYEEKKRDSYWIIHQKAQATLGFIALNEWTKAHTYW